MSDEELGVVSASTLPIAYDIAGFVRSQDLTNSLMLEFNL